MPKEEPFGPVECVLSFVGVTVSIIAMAQLLGPKELTEEEKRERKDICTEATALRDKFKNSTKTKIEMKIIDSKDNEINCAQFLKEFKPSP